MSGWVLAFLVAAMLSWYGTGLARTLLLRRAILDLPNERSSHTVPTPRGGGIAVVGAVLAVWGGVAPEAMVVIAAAVLLTMVSFADDLRGLPPLPRLAAQIIAVGSGLWVLPSESLVFQGWLPLLGDRLATGLLWLWFVNLFNFMDGIDGITGVTTLAVAGGLALVGPQSIILQSLALAGAAVGFLRWNWHPAQIFLGDAGSVPLGYLLGWLLILTAADGGWIPAVILPLYYVADASLTLGSRLIRGENVLQPHRSHFYQRAVKGGASHAQVAGLIFGADVVLVALAMWSQGATLVGAIVVVVLLLVRLGKVRGN